MARIRSIKPEFFMSDDVLNLSPLTRLLYIALWCHVDRAGKGKFNKKALAAQTMPAEMDKFDECVLELQKNDLILIYEVERKGYFMIPTFPNHQRPHKSEMKSVIPDPATNLNGEMHVKSTLDDVEKKLPSVETTENLGREKEREGEKEGKRKGKEKEGKGECEGETAEALPPERELFVKTEKIKATETDYEIVDFLIDRIAANNPAFAQKFIRGSPQKRKELEEKRSRWAEDIEKLRRIDNASEEQIKFVLTWVYGGVVGNRVYKPDSFWRTVIQSGTNFREHFEKIVAKIQQTAEKNRLPSY